MKHAWIFSLVALTGFSCALAQTGDRDMPIEIVADSFSGDEVGQKASYSGNVEVHQGTLEIKGDRLDLKIDAKGYRTLTVIGRPLRIKEKRDPKTPGIEEWVHASALTAVYQEKLDRIVLKDNAKIIRTENGQALDSTEGSVITYDLLHATSRVVGERTDGRKTRISAILSPRPKDKTAAPAPESTNPPALRGETKLRNMR